ncbi:hypothetical protein [Jeotgalicoccus sp. WY2]|uniref:hypothetical protein n=1 Tax=Jeotgalicoccus sp. WY2 TaxID=2708346 RepID=UPI001BD626F2|nr:hypothetical protein [Jeotgalicoccus sp. WY2]
MKSLGFLCLLVVILLFVTLALDLHNFGLLTYGLGFSLTIVYFSLKHRLKLARNR